MGQFAVIQAFTNRGKSQSISHLAKRSVRFGHSCLVVPTEMSNRTWRNRWKSSVTAMLGSELRADPKAYQQQRQQVFRRRSSLYLLAEEEKSMAVDALGTVIDEIAQRFAVDRKRIYLVGDKIGGFMAYRMACQSADLIAGIATLDGATFLEPSRCAPSEPVYILHIHGTADVIVFYEGGALSTTHLVAGRAYTSGGYTYAGGSNDAMGLYNTFYTNTLAETSPGYWKVGSCP